MGRITSRDKEVINFFDQTQIILTTEQIAERFYSAKNKNTSITIARRRLKIMVEMKYIQCVQTGLGNYNQYCSISYHSIELNEHQKMINDFIAAFCSIFNATNITKEYNYFRSIYSLQSDIRIDFIYEHLHLTALVECDRKKTFTTLDKYTKLLSNINNYKNELPYDLIIISYCSSTPKSNDICKPIHITNCSNLIPIKTYLDLKYNNLYDELSQIKSDVIQIKKEIEIIKKSLQ